MSKVPYASAIGSLMYAMVRTRPNIAHAVGVVSRFMSRPGKQHWEAVKWILRYLKGSLDTCLCFTGASLKLQGYVDADFAGDIDSRKSTIGFVFTLGGTSISWASNLQKIVTLSTTEAEYVAATEAGKEMIWLHGFLDELAPLLERATRGLSSNYLTPIDGPDDHEFVFDQYVVGIAFDDSEKCSRPFEIMAKKNPTDGNLLLRLVVAMSLIAWIPIDNLL
ncbi:Retrovirus-related Pol polyprotein from transposon TNT 1-94 [Vitis vinifera]|uniref:Retrovirus-related Pol polyprotein from transposon TNT 1-94 n=1 Tax=Vitis vinifera TaxID=29760 RepID=A0A438JEV0_VITVI|nr:Retrovirus-related Pol polyprotein from transposon TNT 1-94 [Vitis vinifera]